MTIFFLYLAVGHKQKMEFDLCAHTFWVARLDHNVAEMNASHTELYLSDCIAI